MNDLSNYRIYPLSESAAVIDLGNAIDEGMNDKVLAMQQWLKEHPFTGLKDMVAAYSSLTVLYDPLIIYNGLRPASPVFDLVKERLKEAHHASGQFIPKTGKEVAIPVCYDPGFGYDLEEMSAVKHLTNDELIQIHCSTVYRVFMIGFLPGFAYMGKVDEQLATPRRPQPREQVEAGSVGIAGWQTGIYPLQSPGGWQIIGRTPVKLFNASATSPSLLSAGDRVRFYPITQEAFETYTLQTDQHGA
jgi:inhibitor of KinA